MKDKILHVVPEGLDFCVYCDLGTIDFVAGFDYATHLPEDLVGFVSCLDLKKKQIKDDIIKDIYG